MMEDRYIECWVICLVTWMHIFNWIQVRCRRKILQFLPLPLYVSQFLKVVDFTKYLSIYSKFRRLSHVKFKILSWFVNILIYFPTFRMWHCLTFLLLKINQVVWHVASIRTWVRLLVSERDSLCGSKSFNDSPLLSWSINLPTWLFFFLFTRVPLPVVLLIYK